MPDHPKVHRLAEALRVHVTAALGMVTALWARTMRHAPNGDVTDVSETTLRLWCLHPRATWAAFVDAGFVDVEIREDGSQRRVLHGWGERYFDKERRRAANAERQRRWRDKGVTSRVTGTDVTRYVTRDITRDECVTSRVTSVTNNRAEEEEEEEEETTPPPPPPSPRNAAASHGAAAAALVGADAPTCEGEITPKSKSPEDLRVAWNAIASELHLPQAEPLRSTTSSGAKRIAAARLRISEGLLEPGRWAEVCDALRASPFHRGDGPRGWRADFAWLLTADGVTRLLERHRAGPTARPETPAERRRRERQAVMDAVFGVVSEGDRVAAPETGLQAPQTAGALPGPSETKKEAVMQREGPWRRNGVAGLDTGAGVAS